MAAATTIKVPTELRDRLNAEARERGATVAQVIEGLLATRDRAELFRQMAENRARTSAAQWAEYAEEDRLWEDASDEDLRRYDPES